MQSLIHPPTQPTNQQMRPA